MDEKNQDWSLYRSFLAVVRTGSLSAAARALNTTQPTIGRHIEALERSLGGKALFTRSRNGLLPTDVANELLPHAESMDSAADALVRAASGRAQEVVGVVRISASDVVGAEVLPPILAEFYRRHPNVDIELSLSNQTVDLLRRDADIAVRMVMPAQKSLVARKAGMVTLAFHATREYLERHGTPQTFDDLDKHALIGFDKILPPQRFLDNAPFKITSELFTLRCDNDLGQLAALRAGFGIGACQLGIAQRHPQLIPVMLDKFKLQMEIWVVMHENLKRVRRVRAMFDHLADRLTEFARESALLER